MQKRVKCLHAPMVVVTQLEVALWHVHGCAHGVRVCTILAPPATGTAPARLEWRSGCAEHPLPVAAGGYARRPGGGIFGISLSLAISHFKGIARFVHTKEL